MLTMEARPPGDRFRRLIRSVTGISLSPGKAQMIEQRLRRRVVALGLPDTDAFLTQLLDGRLPAQEMEMVIDLITTNTTAFFREPDHFDILSRDVVPAVVAAAPPGRARLKLWSAAASEGAEAWSAAMVLEEQRRAGAAFDYAILGTDISHRMLERARRAVYADAQLATVPAPLQRRYFMGAADPAVAGLSRVVPALRRRVQFRHLNLMADPYPVDRDVDVIFLRNVLIYFEPEDKLRVLRQVMGHLRPGGWLMVGHAESMVVRLEGLAQVRPTIFRRVAP